MVSWYFLVRSWIERLFSFIALWNWVDGLHNLRRSRFITFSLSKQDLKVCEGGILIQLLTFWTLSIVLLNLLSLFWKNRIGLWHHVAVCVCVCVCVCMCIPPIVPRQRLCKNPLIVARQCLGKFPLYLLGNGSVKYYRGNEYVSFSMWPMSYRGK
jgi:hypothetical protein